MSNKNLSCIFNSFYATSRFCHFLKCELFLAIFNIYINIYIYLIYIFIQIYVSVGEGTMGNSIL